jgi:hypothetical protein
MSLKILAAAGVFAVAAVLYAGRPGTASSCCGDEGGAMSATCTGASPCKACKSCKSCAHCKRGGGTCGTCAK